MNERSRPDGSGGQPLSEEQLAALGPQIRLIEAGPGAGKTKTVVARLRARAAAGHCVALLSFTNAAVNVARARCRDAPTLLDPPNFVGTFDQFFHRYVVTPWARRRMGRTPTYLSSWNDLPSHLAVVRPKSGGAGIRLSTFSPRGGGIWEIDDSKLNHTERQAWGKLYETTKATLNQVGTTRINGLIQSFVYDTSAARDRALRILDDPSEPFLGRLTQRFDEIIVDEFQDCNKLEHQLLGRLRRAGIHVVVVADPDQAIYEFRQTSPQLYIDFRATLNVEEIAPLTTCYRSTPVICALTSDLRSVGLHAVTADPRHVGGAEEIHVIVGSGVKAGAAALAIARRHGMTGGQTRVIAHQRSDARALARGGKQPPRGTSQMETLLAPLADLHARGDAKIRLTATRRIEEFVLSQFDWDKAPATPHPTEGPASREHQLELLGTTAQQLRRVVSQLSSAAPGWTAEASCSAGVEAVLREFAEPLELPLIGSLRSRLRVQPKVWEFWLSRTQASLVDASDEVVRWGHIHGVKGEEFDAVILAIPSTKREVTHVLDDWETNANSEQRRVLYVGVSRAKRLLVLVVPKSRRAQLESLLARSRISYAVSLTHKRTPNLEEVVVGIGKGPAAANRHQAGVMDLRQNHEQALRRSS